MSPPVLYPSSSFGRAPIPLVPDFDRPDSAIDDRTASIPKRMTIPSCALALYAPCPPCEGFPKKRFVRTAQPVADYVAAYTRRTSRMSGKT